MEAGTHLRQRAADLWQHLHILRRCWLWIPLRFCRFRILWRLFWFWLPCRLFWFWLPCRLCWFWFPCRLNLWIPLGFHRYQLRRCRSNWRLRVTLWSPWWLLRPFRWRLRVLGRL